MSLPPFSTVEELPGALTLAENVYLQLRREILSCALPPNEKLKLETLRQRFGVGVTPLREALSRLAGEKLVAFRGQRGFRVAPVSMAELEDITFLRSELEPLALRLAIENGDDAWEARVVAAHHHLSLLPRQRWKAGDPDFDDWARRHVAFHNTLVETCGSPRLMAMRATLFDHAQRYQRLFIELGDMDRDDAREHREIFEAVLARDVPKAEALIRAHVLETAVALRKLLTDSDAFAGLTDDSAVA